MSYGQPCRSMTTGPSTGPASAYPTFRRPASICLSGANDAFVPGLIDGRPASLALLGWAFAIPVMTSGAARAIAPAPKKRRRGWLVASVFLIVLINESPLLDCRSDAPCGAKLR